METTLRNSLGNAFFVLTSDVVNRASTFVIYALIARYLGAREFGQLTLALAMFYTFQVLASGGLRTLITRAIALDPGATVQYVVNGSALVIILFLGADLLLSLVLWLLGYPPDTAGIIFLLSLGILPLALTSVYESVFRGWERMKYIAYAHVPINCTKVLLAFFLLHNGRGLRDLVLLLVSCHGATAVTMWILMSRQIRTQWMLPDWTFARRMLFGAGPLLAMDVVIALWAGLPILLLSKLSTEESVGLFGSANQLLVPVRLILQSVAISAFPQLCRRFEATATGLKEPAEQMMRWLLIIAVPTAVALFLWAEDTLRVLYRGDDFRAAELPLKILVWSLVSNAFTTGLGQVLLAGRREGTTLRIVTLNLVVTFVLGLCLISLFGLVGAAIAVLVGQLINTYQHYVPVSKMLPGLSLLGFTGKPGVGRNGGSS